MPHLTRDSLGDLLRQTAGAVRHLASSCLPDCGATDNADCSATAYVIDLTGFTTAACPGYVPPVGLPAWAGDITSGDVASYCGGNTCCWSGPSVTSTYPDGTAVVQRQAVLTNVTCLYNGAIGLEPCEELQNVTSTCWFLLLPVMTGPVSYDLAWAGTKTTGNTPAGVYTRTYGCAAGPETITVR